MARDSDAPQPTRARAVTSLTAELLFAANMAASDASVRGGVDEAAVGMARSQLPVQVLAFLPRLRGLWWPTMGAVDFLCWNGLLDDPVAFLDDMARVPVERFLGILFNQDFTQEAIRGFLADPASFRGRQAGLCEFSSGPEEVLEAIFRDPEGHRAGLLALFRATDTPAFRASHATWISQAAGTLKALERRLETDEPFAVLESLVRKPMTGPRTFDQILFVPCQNLGHRHVRSWAGNQYIFFFQQGALDLGGPTETGADLAEFLKILGDRSRLDILHRLGTGPSYGKEIASALGLTTATVSRHLDQLKAVGLVVEDRADTNNVKVLRFEPAPAARYLERLKNFLQIP